MTKKIQILFVARRFPPSVGGMERFASDLYGSLCKKVDVSLIKWGGSNKYLPIVLPFFFIRSCWLLLRKKIDVIHIQDGLQAPMGVVLKVIFRKPLVVVIHGLDVTYENSLYQMVIPKFLKKADHIICISNAARDEVVKRGVDERKVSFAPLGVTDDLYVNQRTEARKRILGLVGGNINNKKIILSVGRLVTRKGVDWFINNVLPQLVKNKKDIVFVVSGDGEERSKIEDSIVRRHLEPNVRLLGRTDNKVLNDLYNGSDLFVMPNITVPGDMEGFGRVLIEAALCQLPVVASGIEGIKDAVIDGQNGILVKEKDAQAFISSISNLLSDQKKALQLGQKARQFSLDKFNWPKVADQYIKVYEGLLKDYK